MARVRGWQWVCGVVLVCGVMATVSHAQVTFSKLIDFDGTNGSYPYTILIQGTDGNLYGTTESGGTTGACFTGCGTVFKITSSGTLSTLYNFCSQSGCLDGGAPVGALVQAADGNFYGTTSAGGARGNGGTVFKITPGGSLTTLYSFCTLLQCADGEYPSAGLVQAANGAFYGTTRFGGAHGNGGTVYKITPAGVLTTLHSFCSLSNCADGGFSQSELVQARNGNLYGETATGNGVGTIFEITPNDEVSTLFTFDVIDGDYPAGGLIQGTNGNLYGTTAFGGVSNGGCPFFSQGCGTTFKLTSAGILTTLHNFCSSTNCADGDEPYDRMVQGSDGNFYGTTDGYDVSGGTIFEMTPSGALTTLYQFCVVPGCADGEVVYEGLTEVTDGTFYGTTFEGGLYGVGTVFSLSTGLGPFVKTQPASAKEGAKIGIFGQGFTSSSIVQFGGVQASSVKLSGSTFLTARVPAGALTGSVTVTTGATTLTSNQPFRVTPQVLSFNPPSGSVGTQVTITGTGFTQTNGVGFGDNVPAQFTVNSDTQVTATVPTGAQTGPIGVVTKGGTAVSSATFTVN